MLKGLKSLVAGVLAGTALGVLFAPKKGDEIRTKLKKDLKSGGTGFGVIKDTMSEMGKDMEQTAVKTYKKISENPDVKKAIKKGVSEAKKVYGKAKKAVESQVKTAAKPKAKPITKASAKKAVKKVVKKVVKKTSKPVVK